MKESSKLAYIMGTNEHEVQTYKSQFVLTMCTCIHASFDIIYI